jgi:hypothetical protein
MVDKRLVRERVDRPARARNVFKKDRKVVDQRISCCSKCKRGIFDYQERVWTGDGLIHGVCEE